MKAALIDFILYRALTTTIILLASLPSSGPRMIHTFSKASVYTYSFKMSVDFTSRSLSTAINRAMHTISLESSMAHVIVACALVMYPPVSSQAFHLKSLILLSNTKAPNKLDTNWSLKLIEQYLKCHSDILHFFCYCICPKGTAIPDINERLFSTNLGSSGQNLSFLFKYLSYPLLTEATILSHFWSMCLTHQAKVDSWSVSNATANSVTCT